MAKKVRGESHPKPKRASWPASRDEETPEDRAHLDAKLAHQFAEFARLDAKAAPLIVEAERVVEDMTLCATSSRPLVGRLLVGSGGMFQSDSSPRRGKH